VEVGDVDGRHGHDFSLATGNGRRSMTLTKRHRAAATVG
jgi:hypothetical protein